jgi:hypothetical protein
VILSSFVTVLLLNRLAAAIFSQIQNCLASRFLRNFGDSIIGSRQLSSFFHMAWIYQIVGKDMLVMYNINVGEEVMS